MPSADTLRDMPSLWQFGGLTPLNLVKLAAHKFSKDELGTRAASLSYYFVLALFPLMLFLVSLLGVFAPPGSPLQERIMTELSRLAPGSASDLVRNIVHQTLKSSSGIKLAAGILGALWSASGGMGAVTTSLNKIYETDETRPWWKQKLTIVGLTIALSGLIILAIVLALYGERIGAALFAHVGAGGVFRTLWTVLEWPVSFAAMLLTFSLVYYFGPDLKERHWYWVTPGSALGVILWLVASIGFKLYLRFFNSYSATYGSLGAAIILMLWLYNTGFAILIGGELNWIIENQDKKTAEFEARKREVLTQLQAA